MSHSKQHPSNRSQGTQTRHAPRDGGEGRGGGTHLVPAAAGATASTCGRGGSDGAEAQADESGLPVS